jgi:hypothetical protein
MLRETEIMLTRMLHALYLPLASREAPTLHGECSLAVDFESEIARATPFFAEMVSS